jgi:integrase
MRREREPDKEIRMARRGEGIYQRGRTWWLDFTHEGKRHVARLGKGINRTVAGEIAAVKRAAILKGEAGIGRKRKDLDFDKAAEEFLAMARAEKRPRTARRYAECLAQLKRSFGGKRLSEIHPFLLERHKRMRLEEGARVAPNRELQVLRNLYNRCIDWKKYEGDNPVRQVKRLKESRGRERFLEVEEEERLLAELPEPYRTLALVGIHGGLRVRSEALTLRWPDVDLSRGTITVQAAFAKTGETRTVGINSALRPALAALQRHANGREHVFARRDGRPLRSIRGVFMRACGRAKLDGVTPHALRHTFASRLAMAGVDLRTIQELGGWKTLAMVQRYAHPTKSHTAQALERLAHFPTLFPTARPAESGPLSGASQVG